MDNRENRAAAFLEVRAVDDVTVSVEGYAAVFTKLRRSSSRSKKTTR